MAFQLPLSKSDRPAIAAVLVLEKGGSPSNAEACVRQLHTTLSSYDLGHLLYVEFNSPTNAVPRGATKLTWLQSERARLLAAASGSGPAASPSAPPSSLLTSSTTSTTTASTTATSPSSTTTSSTTTTSSSSPSGATLSAAVRVKVERGVNVPLSQNYLLSATSDAADLPVPDQRYLDPMTGSPEEQEDHRKRYHMWGGLVEPMLVHYPHLLRDRGDFSKISQAISAMSGMCTDDVFCDALTSLCALSKPANVPFSEFALKVANLRSTFEHLSDPDLRIPDKFIRLFVLRALGSDSRYNVTLNFLRRDRSSLDATLTQLVSEASTLESVSAPSPDGGKLHGLAAVQKGPCYAFQRHGRCRKGKRCPFQHVPGTPPERDPPKSSSAKPTGKCLECGGSHSIDSCDIFKARHLRMEAARQAMAASLPPSAVPVALPVAPAVVPPTPEVLHGQQARAAGVASSALAFAGLDPVILAAINATPPSSSGGSQP